MNRAAIEPTNAQEADTRFVYLRDLLFELVVRDLKVRYQSSALGFAWTLISPVMLLMVFYFVFQVIIAIDVPRYASYVFLGILVFTWFQSSLQQGAYAITANSELIMQPGFPATVLPIVTVATQLIHFMFALPVLIPFLLMEDSQIGVTALSLPILLLVQFILTLALAYLVAGINVIFRDVGLLLEVVLRLLFFLTPIFYQVEMVPESIRPYYLLNPMVELLQSYRAVLIYGTAPNWSALLIIGLASTLLLVICYRIFTSINYRFTEEL